MKKLFMIMIFFILSGCISVPQKSTSTGAIELQGLFAIVTPKSNQSGHFIWEQAGSADFSLELYGPLGLGATTLIQQNGLVTLETDQGKKYTATSPEALLQNTLGWSMPIHGMLYWLLGIPVPTVPFSAQYNAVKQISDLTQSGWQIHYQGGVGAIYPERIVMQRQSIRLIVLISSS
ncbi:MAG: lipoprotein insertase outer membrane protein LolB [Gammaproteobacteria bacterium]|nr:lipoprotein insertase outer membrane protein LolB [Gammaproteobacteria bacterium]